MEAPSTTRFAFFYGIPRLKNFVASCDARGVVYQTLPAVCRARGVVYQALPVVCKAVRGARRCVVQGAVR